MTTNVLGINGTDLILNGEKFYLQGISFFNAIYNRTFNSSPDTRMMWLRTFLENGVNTPRIWCQWNFEPPHTFIDVDPDHSMYTEEGSVREQWFRVLSEILTAADRLGMVVEVTLFSNERKEKLPVGPQENATREMARLLKPFRNVILQIWNECSFEVKRCFEAAKAEDADCLVTNSPGGSNVLGDDEQNTMLDLLTPHTVRRQDPRFWEVAPRQIASLIERFQKPVIDDEPARDGTINFGGIEGGTRPEYHIRQCESVRRAGGYHIYHHDMFQNEEPDRTPPNGIPDPDFRPFHREVFDYLNEHTRW